MKNILSLILYYLGISFILFKIINRKGTIRSVNYHCTPFYDSVNFESQLKFYKKYFQDINLETLDSFFNTGKPFSNLKPGIIITFDDGLRSNYENVLSFLDKYGLTGWFCIPVGFILNPSKEFAIDNLINFKQEFKDNTYGMNLNEIKSIAKNHVIVCHTYSHHRFRDTDSIEKLNHEILNSKIELEEIVGRYIYSFCWVGGELEHYTKAGYQKIIESGYKYSFTTNNSVINYSSDKYNLNRSNIESSDPLHLVLFQISGIMDLFYWSKRSKVKKIFKIQ